MKKLLTIFYIFFFYFIVVSNSISQNLIYLNKYQLTGTKNFVNDFNYINQDNYHNAVIEIPSGTNEKWEASKDGKYIELEFKNGKPRTVDYLSYPFNYGFIPRTLLSYKKGGDGDPVDILVYGQRNLKRGTVVSVKIIGMLLIKDQGEIDNKVISVLKESRFENVKSLDDLEKKYPGILDITNIWFNNYKGIRMEINGYLNKKKTIEFIKKSNQEYEKNN